MHIALQRKGILPGTINSMEPGEKAFVYASFAMAIEAEAKEREERDRLRAR